MPLPLRRKGHTVFSALGLVVPAFAPAVPALGPVTPAFAPAVPALGPVTPAFAPAVPALGPAIPAFTLSSRPSPLSAPR
ncbi:hypothetical protein ACIPSA_32370 [Streptomyces sp. NPDC086549]|uniref:hypothetical protein n=1 Tax=Streptomyces sp. NPDC086549 TaxID=3365752 RepID=UPI003818B815